MMISVDALASMYCKNDLAKNKVFSGGFINFGYWEGINISTLTERDDDLRSLASKNLYKLCIRESSINESSIVAELGCGHGIGSIMIAEEYRPKMVLGVDFFASQIARAKMNQQIEKCALKNIRFIKSSALGTTLEDNSVDTILSIEAPQSFHPISDFALECYRILKDKGEVILSFHTSTTKDAYAEVKNIFNFLKVDDYKPISDYCDEFISHGFQCVKIQSIGSKVFYGFEKWSLFFETPSHWARNYYKQFLKGNLDYYLIKLKKWKR